MKTTQTRELELKILATWCFAAGLFLFLNLAAWCNIADTIKTQPRKAPIPLNLPLSGTVNGNQYQKGSTIESTQVIESGKTTYLAEEEVVLNEGFEVMDGAEFEVMIDRDSFHIVTMMTYNLWIQSTDKYKDHADIIKESKADVVSVQEVKGETRFNNILKKNSGYEGKMYSTMKRDSEKYGIAMLWNPKTIDKPIDIQDRPIDITHAQRDKDKQRAYIIAEFRDFCFVATHFSLDQPYRNQMAYMILEDDIVQRCTTSGKPVYVAGDMNERPEEPAIKIFKDNGLGVLNRMETIENGKYIDSTMDGGTMIDLILEYNTNPYRKEIDKGIALSETRKDGWLKKKISDHFPYFVKLKVK